MPLAEYWDFEWATRYSFERWEEEFETDVYSFGPLERDVAQRVIIASGRECYSK